MDERCAGVLRRDGSSNTSQYAVLHVEWQTGIHASNRRAERAGRNTRRWSGGEEERVGGWVEVSCALHDTFLHTLPYARSLPSWSENGSCRSVLSGTTIRCISDCTEIPIYGYVSTHVGIYEGTYVHIYIYVYVYVHTYTRNPGCPGKNGEDATSYVVVPCVWNVRQPDTFLETISCRLISSGRIRPCTESYSLFCLTDCPKGPV